MQICILTNYLHNNYGGLLQAYALQKVLKQQGHEAVTDRYGCRAKQKNLFKLKMPFHKRIIRFVKHFVKKYIFKKHQYNPFIFLASDLWQSKEEIKLQQEIAVNTKRFIDNNITTIDFWQGKNKPSKRMIKQFDAIVVGSDQVFRPRYCNVPAYFLYYVKNDILRISYAASFGKDDWSEFSSDITKKCAVAAKKFKAVSVREESAVTLCKNYLGVPAEHLIDPTLLLEKEEYIHLIENDDSVPKEHILMCYLLDRSDEKNEIKEICSKKLNLNAIEVMPEELFHINASTIEKCIYPSVSKWIAGFRDAQFVLTDSFHGTVFAIIFNKPFIAIANNGRGIARFSSLLKIFGLEDRLIFSVNDIQDKLFQPINYMEVNKIKKEWQNKSFNFLLTNLKVTL